MVSKGLVASRSQAFSYVKLGHVLVDGEMAKKAGLMIDESAKIEVIDQFQYVGRGGLKLAEALEIFKVDVSGATCIDVGASTGGFTECLLRHGADLIYAIDTGKDQLREHLKSDPRVVSMEQCDIRNLGDLDLKFDLAVVDVSFISLRLVLPYVLKHLKDRAQMVVLFKPQFECGPDEISKGGVVRNPVAVKKAFVKFCKWAEKELGVQAVAHFDSSVKGKSGNQELMVLITFRERG